MGAVLLALMAVPLAASVACWWAPARLAKAMTLVAGATTLGLTVALISGDDTTTALSGWVRVDALS
ncbi:MAG: hypothetical protein ABSE47_16605, partial [Acidimicrobiales bacterium]